MKTKEFYRNFYRDKRQEISALRREEFSEKIRENIQKFLSKKNPEISGYIALFAGTSEEPDLLPFVKTLGTSHGWSLKRKTEFSGKFCFPRITDFEKGKMEFYEVVSFNDLEPNSFGILEPKKSCRQVSPSEISVMCIPAVSIDLQGNRIGMGGGFYDRYTAKLSKSYLTIGTIFSCQISENSFAEFSENFDIPVQKVVSEKGVL